MWKKLRELFELPCLVRKYLADQHKSNHEVMGKVLLNMTAINNLQRECHTSFDRLEKKMANLLETLNHIGEQVTALNTDLTDLLNQDNLEREALRTQLESTKALVTAIQEDLNNERTTSQETIDGLQAALTELESQVNNSAAMAKAQDISAALTSVAEKVDAAQAEDTPATVVGDTADPVDNN